MIPIREMSISDIFARAVPYPVERLTKPIQDEGLKPHKEIIADVFNILKDIPNGDALRIALGVNSQRLLAYWYGQASEWILRFSQRQRFSKGEQWVTAGNEKILVTTEDIDGPVDVRELTIQRETSTERDKITISLDRGSGALEEVMYPVTLKSEVKRSPEDDPTKIYKITFLEGRIAKLELQEYVEDTENSMPSFIRTTILDFTSVVRWGIRRD